MKRLIYLVFGVLVIGAIAYLVYEYRSDFGLGGSRGRQESSNVERTIPNQRLAQIVWQTVDRTTDGFKIQMPAGASETQIPVYTEHGVAEQVDMIETSVDPETTYAIAWADNPPVERVSSGEGAEMTLDMARDGALGRTQTTLVSETRENRDGYPSRDFSGRNGSGGILNARLILAGTRLYVLIAVFPSASARRDEDMNHFFDSFSLTTAPPGN